MEELFNNALEAWRANNESKFESAVLTWIDKSEGNPFDPNDPIYELYFRASKYYWQWRSGSIDARRSRIKCLRNAKELFAMNPANPYSKKEEETTQEEKVIEEAVAEEVQEAKHETEDKAEEVKTETEEIKETVENNQPAEKVPEQIHVFGVVPENTAEIGENFAEKSAEVKLEESIGKKVQNYNPNAKPPFFGKRKR